MFTDKNRGHWLSVGNRVRNWISSAAAAVALVEVEEVGAPARRNSSPAYSAELARIASYWKIDSSGGELVVAGGGETTGRCCHHLHHRCFRLALRINAAAAETGCYYCYYSPIAGLMKRNDSPWLKMMSFRSWYYHFRIDFRSTAKNKIEINQFF